MLKESKQDVADLQQRLHLEKGNYEALKVKLLSAHEEELKQLEKKLEDEKKDVKKELQKKLEKCREKRSSYKVKLLATQQQLEEVTLANSQLAESKLQLQKLTEYLSSINISVQQKQEPSQAVAREKEVVYVQQPKEYVEKIIQQPVSVVKEVIEVQEKPREVVNTVIEKQVPVYQRPEYIRVIKEQQPYTYLQEEQPLQKSYVEVTRTSPRQVVEKQYITQQPVYLEKKIISEVSFVQSSQVLQSAQFPQQVQTDAQGLYITNQKP